MNNSFLAILFRMKYINRWSLMYNTRTENLSEHTLECALITHYLATIGNTYFSKMYNAEKLSVYAMFHDATEILTGDLPTPIKYYNEHMKKTYKEVEKVAADKISEYAPNEMKDIYKEYLLADELTDDEKKLIKTADKISAYIKCISEKNAGNSEFNAAYETIRQSLLENGSDEAKYFMENVIPSFMLSIDELQALF